MWRPPIVRSLPPGSCAASLVNSPQDATSPLGTLFNQSLFVVHVTKGCHEALQKLFAFEAWRHRRSLRSSPAVWQDGASSELVRRRRRRLEPRHTKPFQHLSFLFFIFMFQRLFESHWKKYCISIFTMLRMENQAYSASQWSGFKTSLGSRNMLKAWNLLDKGCKI